MREKTIECLEGPVGKVMGVRSKGYMVAEREFRAIRHCTWSTNKKTVQGKIT